MLKVSWNISDETPSSILTEHNLKKTLDKRFEYKIASSDTLFHNLPDYFLVILLEVSGNKLQKIFYVELDHYVEGCSYKLTTHKYILYIPPLLKIGKLMVDSILGKFRWGRHYLASCYILDRGKLYPLLPQRFSVQPKIDFTKWKKVLHFLFERDIIPYENLTVDDILRAYITLSEGESESKEVKRYGRSRGKWSKTRGRKTKRP